MSRSRYPTMIAAVALLSLAAGCSDDTTTTCPDAASVVKDVSAADTSTCGLNTKLCGSSCVNTNRDNKHCGACDKACKTGELCGNGKCALSCPTGQVGCVAQGICVDVKTDRNNCGGCGKLCKAGEVCSAGTCGLSCPTGQSKCATGGPSPFCANLTKDLHNCGGCGTTCKAGEVCSNSACALICPGGQSKCGGGDAGVASCANLKSDNLNCGACGNVCKAGEVCTSGTCVLSCAAGQSKCGGGDAGTPYCANLQTDNYNCGVCGTSCVAGQLCTAGKCALSCPTGQSKCGGGVDAGAPYCANLQTENLNCGVCGTACKAGEVCSTGTCGVTCKTGLSNCSGSCVDLGSALKHCGACGTVCKAGQSCTSGKCVKACGNGAVDPGEQCDGTLLASKTCVTLGYYAGTLVCSAACALDLTGCHRCGDGVINGKEACDGTVLGGKTCKNSGFDHGTIKCGATCALDTTGCTKCSDKLKNGDETDVDCGGSCATCALGKKCTINKDCTSTLCLKGVCASQKSCKDLLSATPGLASGTYTIKPGSTAFSVYCDMSTFSGGWTRIRQGHKIHGKTFVDQTKADPKGVSYSQIYFKYVSGSARGGPTYPTSHPSSTSLIFRLSGAGWTGVTTTGGSSCSFSYTKPYKATYLTTNAKDFYADLTKSHTSTIQVATLEALASCTTSDNTGPAVLDIYVR